MFKLNEKYQFDRKLLKCDYIRYSPSEISTINTPNSQIYNCIPGGDSVCSLYTSFRRLNFDVLDSVTNDRYKDGDSVRLVNLTLIALFNIYKLNRSSGKQLEYITQAQIASLMYKLLTSSRGSDGLSIGFNRSRDRRQRELTNNKKTKAKNHVTIMLKDIFGFVEHQEKATYGFGYNLILTRNIDNAVLSRYHSQQ